jgi:hypothetical protein
MIKPPKWCAHAIPTNRGWADPVTGELYISRKLTQEQIDEFLGNDPVIEDPVVVIPEEPEWKLHVFPELVEEESAPEPEVLTEAPANNKSLEDMTKAELLALAEQTGVAVSKRSNKATLVEKLSS